MHHAFGDVLAASALARGAVGGLLIRRAFGLLILLLFGGIVVFCHIRLLSRSALGRRRFFAGDGFSRPFARARIRVRALAVHRQALSMPEPSVRAHIDMT